MRTRWTNVTRWTEDFGAMVSYVATLPPTPDNLAPIPTSADRRALTDWAHEVVSDLVDALNVTFDRVTDTVTLPEGRSR